MSTLHPLTTVPTLAAVAAFASGPTASAVSTYELTGGRLASIVGIALGVAGVAGVVFSRRRRAGREGRAPGRLALVGAALGLAGTVTGAGIVALADGGPGSGSEIVGGVLCLAIGLIAVVLAAPALRRPASEASVRGR